MIAGRIFLSIFVAGLVCIFVSDVSFSSLFISSSGSPEMDVGNGFSSGSI